MRPNPLKHGFTLVEVMFAAGIMLIAIGGLLGTYVLCFNLAETAKNLTLANNAIQLKLEEIRYQNIETTTFYDNTTFDIPGFAAGSNNTKRGLNTNAIQI